MKFRLTFKTPDALEYAINDAIDSFVPESDFTHEELVEYDNIDDEDEKRELIRQVVEAKAKFIKDTVDYGESITVDFDSETQTATVVR